MGLSLGGPSVSLGPKNRILGALGLPGASDFAMRDLWGKGEQGAWYDPSDFERYIVTDGVELLTNGSLDSATGWNLSATAPATNSIAGGVYTFNSPAGEAVFASQSVLTVGEWYEVTLEITAVTGAGVRVITGSNATAAGIADFNTTGTKTVRLKNDGTNGTFFLSRAGTGSGTVTSVSVKRLAAINTASLFQDAAGTAPVTAMEQPVGLMLDKRLGVVRGPELASASYATSPTYDNITTPTSATSFSVTGGTTASRAYMTVPGSAAGKSYEVTFRVVSITGGGAIQAYSRTAADSNGATINNTAGLIAGQIGRLVYTATGVSSVMWVSGTAGAAFVIDNISVREIPGNHASQATTTARPLLSARKNLQLSSENFLVAPWARTNTTVTANAVAAPDGSMTGSQWVSTANLGSHVTASVAIPTGATATRTVRAKAISGTGVLALEIARDGVLGRADFNLINGSVSVTGVVGGVASITAVGNGWYDCAATFTASGAGTNQFQATYIGAYGASPTVTTIGVMFSQVEYGSVATRYQRVNTATDYDWVGFPMYLKFDGVDDFLQTGSINFTATNKMVVVAGVTKLSDAVSALLVETSVDSNGNDGAFSVRATQGTGASGNYGVGGRGTVSGMVYQSTAGAQPAPHTGVLTGRYDFGVTNVSEQLKLSVNGVAQTLQSVIAGPTGVGNFGTYPMYIGRRGGTTLPFTGYLYSLVVRGAASTTPEIVNAERAVAAKTGVTL